MTRSLINLHIGGVKMGNVFSHVILTDTEIKTFLKPIIYCFNLNESGIEIKSVNIELAQELALLHPRRRALQLKVCFDHVLDRLPFNVVIKDFDVMFNPAYEADVLEILVTACKQKPFSVIWPGHYKDGKLIYAEEGYSDYRAFNINNYDVTCIV